MSQDLNRSLSSPGILSKAGRYFQNRVRLVTHVLRIRSSKPQTIPESPSQPPEPRVETSPLPRDPTHSSNPIVSTSTMSGSQIIEVLRECRVLDVTNELKGSENSPISFGSSGYLYHARNAEEEVAVRTIRLFLAFNNKNRRLLESAGHELLVWQRLQHQNILPLIGVACFQGQVALVSPWMSHGSIEDFQRKEPLFDRMKMCAQVARAVAYLHENDVVHGDIKAQNILVSNDGKAKLIGFGNAMLRELAMYYRDGHDFSTLSLRWTAPEVLGGYSSKSREIDVYALGMTMLEIITGKLPFDETKSDQEVLVKIMSRTIPSRPQELAANDPIWTLLTRCWDANPSNRPSGRDVCAILEPLAK